MALCLALYHFSVNCWKLSTLDYFNSTPNAILVMCKRIAQIKMNELDSEFHSRWIIFVMHILHVLDLEGVGWLGP